jgi:thioredoxin
MVVTEVHSESQFASELASANGRPVVVDFHATWCGPCKAIAPKVQQLSDMNPQCVFLKVDVDKVPGVAQAHNISSMPTFLFFVNGTKVDQLKGADSAELERKVKHWADSTAQSAGSDGQPVVPGQMELSTFYEKAGIECLNDDKVHSLLNMLGGVCSLKSDADEQLLIALRFNQPVKLHSISIKAPGTHGPRSVRLFTNQPTTLDFEQAEDAKAVQDIYFTSEQLDNGEVINLRYVKFQNVHNVQIFVKDNVGDTDCTEIGSIRFYGTPLQATNMTEFKRVAGKAGESHS